jgi:hypothetical protein
MDALEWLRKHLEVEGKHDGARALGLRIAAETSTRELRHPHPAIFGRDH